MKAVNDRHNLNGGPRAAVSFFRICRFAVRLCAVAALAVLGGALRAQTPATLADLGGSTPTPGSFDVYQLGTSGQADMPDGLNYYTDNQSDHGAGEPGQTFTTGNGASGFLLSSIAIKTGGGTTSNTGTS